MKSETVNLILQWVKDRLAEPSTKAGLVLVASSLGIILDPGALGVILGGLVNLIGLALIVRAEEAKPKD